MKVIPAIDIMGGKVVRLKQGVATAVKVYSDSPIDMARQWVSYGVDLLHVVDLDGALEGKLKNLDIVKEIVKNVSAKVELGGGIRDEKTIEEVLKAGVDKVVIGTKALDERFLLRVGEIFGDRIVVSIDGRDGIVYTKGWVEDTRTNVIDLVNKIEMSGIRTINYTDITRDGTLEGFNIKSLEVLLEATTVDVVAAGGISSLIDLKRLKPLEKEGLAGIIIGKALYEGTVDLGEAIKICGD